MHEYYVFPHPTVAEGKPGTAAFKVNPNYGQYDDEKYAGLNKLNPYVDFNVYDIRQLLHSYGIFQAKIVYADDVASAIGKSKHMDAAKLIASKDHFNAQQFEMMNRTNKPLTEYLRENHAYRIAFDSYPYNLGLDIQNLRGDRISRDRGMVIGQKKIIKLFDEDGVMKRYKAMQMHVDASFVRPPPEKDLAKTSKKPDKSVVFVPAGTLMVLKNENKYWDPESYIIMPDFARQAAEIAGRRNLSLYEKPKVQPLINVA